MTMPSFESTASFISCRALTSHGFLNAFGTRHCAASDPSKLLSALGAAGWDVKIAKQTHSDVRMYLEENPALEGDAFITRKTNVLPAIKTADCVPILIGDPKTGAMAAVHAGWRGTASKIVQKSVKDLTATFRSNPEDLIAAIGPSACADCYEVGPEVAEQFAKEFLKPAKSKGKFMLNVAAANQQQLIDSRLNPSNIHLATHCTMHQNDLFFSHRREGGDGRQLSVIGRKDG